jgi:hypothetical protein
MSGPARVTSIDVLQTLATALQRFRSEAAAAMEDAELETHRAMQWMQYDCKEYWAREVRRSEEAVTQARLQLKQARSARKVAGHDPICIDEERALKRAQHRQETARRKVEAVRQWTRSVETAIHHVQRSRIRLLGWLDTDLTKAVAALNRMSGSLESYISIEAPAGSGILAADRGPATVEEQATTEGPTQKNDGGRRATGTEVLQESPLPPGEGQGERR